MNELLMMTITREEAINGIPGLLDPLDPSLSQKLQEEIIENRLLRSRDDIRLDNERDDSLQKGLVSSEEKNTP